MTGREAALLQIDVGDIFHAVTSTGASFICLTLRVGHDAIFARRITTQSVHWFDRATGIEGPECSALTIDAVAPLPDDIMEIMLEMDRKYHEWELRHAEDPAYEPAPHEMGLTKEHRKGLAFAADFYESNQI